LDWGAFPIERETVRFLTGAGGSGPRAGVRIGSTGRDGSG
jgi:hypothetical protein